MNKILVQFAHPAFRRSKINAALREAVTDIDGVTVHDLYACYPDFLIDVPHEQRLCEEHDIIVFQHPFYWYSTPSIVKETLPALYKIHREDEARYISMYQQHNDDLAALMTQDREMDMEELDKAWTAASPES